MNKELAVVYEEGYKKCLEDFRTMLEITIKTNPYNKIGLMNIINNILLFIYYKNLIYMDNYIEFDKENIISIFIKKQRRCL